MMRLEQTYSKVSPQCVVEIAAVGIYPAQTKHNIGEIIHLGGHPFTVIGYATREEFRQAYQAVETRYPVSVFDALPNSVYYLKVTTD